MSDMRAYRAAFFSDEIDRLTVTKLLIVPYTPFYSRIVRWESIFQGGTTTWMDYDGTPDPESLAILSSPHRERQGDRGRTAEDLSDVLRRAEVHFLIDSESQPEEAGPDRFKQQPQPLTELGFGAEEVSGKGLSSFRYMPRSSWKFIPIESTLGISGVTGTRSITALDGRFDLMHSVAHRYWGRLRFTDLLFAVQRGEVSSFGRLHDFYRSEPEIVVNQQVLLQSRFEEEFDRSRFHEHFRYQRPEGVTANPFPSQNQIRNDYSWDRWQFGTDLWAFLRGEATYRSSSHGWLWLDHQNRFSFSMRGFSLRRAGMFFTGGRAQEEGIEALRAMRGNRGRSDEELRALWREQRESSGGYMYWGDELEEVQEELQEFFDRGSHKIKLGSASNVYRVEATDFPHQAALHGAMGVRVAGFSYSGVTAAQGDPQFLTERFIGGSGASRVLPYPVSASGFSGATRPSGAQPPGGVSTVEQQRLWDAEPAVWATSMSMHLRAAVRARGILVELGYGNPSIRIGDSVVLMVEDKEEKFFATIRGRKLRDSYRVYETENILEGGSLRTNLLLFPSSGISESLF